MIDSVQSILCVLAPSCHLDDLSYMIIQECFVDNISPASHARLCRRHLDCILHHRIIPLRRAALLRC